MSKQPQQIPTINITCPGGVYSSDSPWRGCRITPSDSSNQAAASKSSSSYTPSSNSYYASSLFSPSNSLASAGQESTKCLEELQKNTEARMQNVKRAQQQERIKRGELHALPYDDNGNMLTAEALRGKLETYWAKTNPPLTSNSTPQESIEDRKARFDEEIKQFKGRKPFDFEAEKQKMLQAFEEGSKLSVVKVPNMGASTFVSNIATLQSTSDISKLPQDIRAKIEQSHREQIEATNKFLASSGIKSFISQDKILTSRSVDAPAITISAAISKGIKGEANTSKPLLPSKETLTQQSQEFTKFLSRQFFNDKIKEKIVTLQTASHHGVTNTSDNKMDRVIYANPLKTRESLEKEGYSKLVSFNNPKLFGGYSVDVYTRGEELFLVYKSKAYVYENSNLLEYDAHIALAEVETLMNSIKTIYQDLGIIPKVAHGGTSFGGLLAEAMAVKYTEKAHTLNTPTIFPPLLTKTESTRGLIESGASSHNLMKAFFSKKTDYQKPAKYDMESRAKDLSNTIQDQNYEIAKDIIEKIEFNSVSQHGRTVLFYAVQMGDFALVKSLIDQGYDVNKADKYFCTPLHVAASFSQHEIARLLLSKGAKADTVCSDSTTPIDSAKTELMKQILLGNSALSETAEVIVARIQREKAQQDKLQSQDEIKAVFATELNKYVIINGDSTSLIHSLLTDKEVQHLVPVIKELSNVQQIQILDLSNNQIGDDGAKYIASYLSSGQHPNLKALDLSGNLITSTGYGYFAEGMKSPKVENFMVTFVKEIGSKGKEFIKSSLKAFMHYAKQQGIDTMDIVTDKGTYEYFKDQMIIAKNLRWGYFKCMTYLDYVTDGFNMSDIGYEVMLKKCGKKIPGLHVFTCILQAADEAFTMPEGVNLIGKAIEFIEE